jgi:predicted RNase H-like nuclease (RuvC/YqgF family)
VNVPDALCDYETRIKAIVFMGDKGDKKETLWDSIKRLMGDDLQEKNEVQCPSTPFSCCDKSARDDFEEQIEQMRGDDREKIKTMEKLLEQAVELIATYRAKNEQAVELIATYRAKNRDLKNENKSLKHSIFLMKEDHKFQIDKLELKLKHQRQSMMLLMPPSTSERFCDIESTSSGGRGGPYEQSYQISRDRGD